MPHHAKIVGKMFGACNNITENKKYFLPKYCVFINNKKVTRSNIKMFTQHA